MRAYQLITEFGVCQRPTVKSSLKARVYRLLGPTQLALDLTAPVESARAPLHDHYLLCPVPAAAAHQVTPVHAYTGVVTLPAVRPLDAELGVALAEHGRRLQVDQILRARRFVLRVVRPQLEVVLAPLADFVARTPRVVHHHPGGAVEAVLQVVSDDAEVGQSHPARLDGAGPRHAVTLAFLLHLRHHMLKQKKAVSKCTTQNNSINLLWQ